MVNPSLPGVSLDLDRAGRCGFPEVVYGEGKLSATIVEIFQSQQAAGQGCLATRVSPEQAEAVTLAFSGAIQNAVARTVRVPAPDRGRLTPERERAIRGETEVALLERQFPARQTLVVTAGTSDRPVAEEALETLAWMDVPARLLTDIGVAGPQRLLGHVAEMQSAAVIVVVAGMEGALPSVVGGWVACPVIAVPTSVGYGTSFQGLTALLGMLNSCAANVAVVNIDAGFKAGYLAGLIAHRSAPVAT